MHFSTVLRPVSRFARIRMGGGGGGGGGGRILTCMLTEYEACSKQMTAVAGLNKLCPL